MERIDLAGLTHTVTREWRSAGGATIRIGTAGEKWFTWHSRRGAWVHDHERSACDQADKWLMRGGVWTEVTVAEGIHP